MDASVLAHFGTGRGSSDQRTAEAEPTNDCSSREILPLITDSVPCRDWQFGRSLNDCMLNVYSNSRWTDMVIRCGGTNVSRPLKAHKIILAARSPVFEAMLFGPCRDPKCEFNFPSADVGIFDKMLRFMYTDDAHLEGVDEAMELMSMAHMYQITCLVDHCVMFLLNNISSSNVCKSLECALKFNVTMLRDVCCDFIDTNTIDVLKTDEFLAVPIEVLAYILKGDTFFIHEDYLFHRVEEWAKLRLSELGIEENGKNIRDILGKAFCSLRLPTLSSGKMMECIKRKGYFSIEEYEDMVECNMGRISKLNFISNIRRVPAEQKVTLSCSNETKQNEIIDQTLQIRVGKTFYLKYIEIPVIKSFLKFRDTLYKTYEHKRLSVEGQNLPTALNPKLTVVVKIDKINFEHRSIIHQDSDVPSKIVFDEPALLKKYYSPFEVHIRIEPAMRFPNLLLSGTYGKVQTLNLVMEQKHVSVSQIKASMIGISAIGVHNCSFREIGEDSENEYVIGTMTESEIVSDSEYESGSD